MNDYYYRHCWEVEHQGSVGELWMLLVVFVDDFDAVNNIYIVGNSFPIFDRLIVWKWFRNLQKQVTDESNLEELGLF